MPLTFNYPLDNEPNLIIDVGEAAEGGVGPNNSIVAFSNICQHLGCFWGYLPKGGSPPCNGTYSAAQPMAYCCCHGSQYDFLKEAEVIGGPAPRPVPMVQLEVDSSGNIYAVGMNPPTIYGHDTGSSDVTQDLIGGNLITSITVTTDTT